MNLKTAISLLDLKSFKTIDDLKIHFRQKAHALHPDKNHDRDTSAEFRDVVDAYKFLLEHASEVFRYFGVSEKQVEEASVKIAIDSIDDIFEDIFGFSKSGRVFGYQEPQPLYLTIEEFAFGAKKKQRLVAYISCTLCHGTGNALESTPRICTYCFGQGSIVRDGNHNRRYEPQGPPKAETQDSATNHGVLTGKLVPGGDKRVACPHCGGRGRRIKTPCERCEGFGRIKQTHTQEFTVPIGLKPFETYTLSGFDAHTKHPTDIFIEPRPLHHPIFKIENHNLLCEYHANFEKLTTPVTLFLTSPFGKVPLTLTPQAKDGDKMILAGCGFYKDSRKKERGNLIVTLRQKKKAWWKFF